MPVVFLAISISFAAKTHFISDHLLYDKIYLFSPVPPQVKMLKKVFSFTDNFQKIYVLKFYRLFFFFFK